MSTIRVNKSKDFTVMSNYHLKDYSLSLKTKGLLSYMFSLPENWDYSVRGLSTVLPESEGTIKTILKELEAKGYLVREQKIEAGGKFGKAEYTLYENPADNQKYQPSVKNPTAVNCTANISTKQQSTKEKRDKKENRNVDRNGFLSENSPSKQTTKELDPKIVSRQVRKICNELNFLEDNFDGACFEVIEYYLEKYKVHFSIAHPIVSNRAMKSIITALWHGTQDGTVSQLCIHDDTLGIYKDMIDKHFKVHYGKDVDYNISHFMTDGIRTNRYYETCL